MNEPEYIVTDELRAIVLATKTALGLPVLNFQHGYRNELNETISQMEKADPATAALIFPMIWLAQPFKVKRGIIGFYGEISGGAKLYIFKNTDKNKKAVERVETVFKPILYPIYREFLKQLDLSVAFSNTSVSDIQHSVTDIYYWGEEQQASITTPVDCIEISDLPLRINNNNNCQPFKSF